MQALMKNGTNVGVERITHAPLSPTDVLINVAVAGFCRTDMYVAQGRIASKDPLVLGHEFAGTVEKVGSDVTHLRAGDRVTVMPLFPHEQDVLRNGLPSYARATMMGVHHDGAFSELAIAPAKSVYKLPDHVSFMQGAYMEPIAASMAVLNASIHAGQKGLVFGDNRISRLTERVLRAKGFDNITVCSSEDTLEDNAYDFVVETLATTETMQRMVRSVRPGGRIVLKSRQHTPISINVNDLVLKDVAMEAVSYGDFAQGIELIASGKLAIDDLFGDVYPLERFETVFAHANRGETKKLFFSAAGPDVWTC